ncbi:MULTISPECIES: DEAD/DEAH box helicase family protein [Mycobacteroides]|uniref:Restriction endonuclease subunit R n=1 Tax=Mycobacteroides chelonae TaxID=1774 RepID=A0A1S1LLQ6_MYCCH|nr:MULTISPECIES: DEAD/DEAH box helicase family protein [Mycobacteroides]KRQ22490.1 restriction endonuclease subunit R [Mycobacteroides sp. H092]KRQ24380.1 restriction endonuclease subunit R [Mycobacteroides sp. H003]KRQ40068.1 restriction endonuclease subunit R [Mycobacteroides sp. H101]KRQ46890.1 restriction endonuclease subunit R [Mycobacteroides sp. H063]KRQ58351.1 restriction endonuclease subunit R [Mycobacteroides sp. HXVII]
MSGFLSQEHLLAGGPTGLNHAAERTLWHLGFKDVRLIDGANDHGADILAVRRREQWVFQCKFSSRGFVNRTGVDDAERARAQYGADHAVIVTNTGLNSTAEARRKALAGIGIKIDVWNGATLSKIFDQMPDSVPETYALRHYQSDAAECIEKDLSTTKRSLLILATGLGKTVVGGEVIRRHLADHPQSSVLVVAHVKELVEQLEKALWRHLDKKTPTQVLHGDRRPVSFDGVTVATVDSVLGLIRGGWRPALIMIDETHHVAETGMFAELLDTCSDAKQFGVTATPWRGDKFDITTHFGAPSYSMSIAEGMAQGYLARVDYRMFVDNLDWDFVRNISEHGYSVRELNRSLFLPQRDEEIVDNFRSAWRDVHDPRAIVFCQTIEHAERMASLLQGADQSWRRAAFLHSGMSRQRRQVLLNAFRLGRVPIITCVDVFNEGVDVPDVNLIAFLRVTHSRRIFVQQLGRGLRLREGKESLKVLDFVTDIRRVAAGLDLRRSLATHSGVIEELALPLASLSRITFSDETAGSLLDHWIRDAADLETAADEVHLQFPTSNGIA